MKISKTIYFEACHHLPNYDGDCSKLHGHSYRLEVIVDGHVNRKTGMLIDFKELKRAIEATCGKYDHSDLNDHFKMPTAELMVLKICEDLTKLLRKTITVKLWETKYSYAECRCKYDD